MGAELEMEVAGMTVEGPVDDGAVYEGGGLPMDKPVVPIPVAEVPNDIPPVVNEIPVVFCG